MLAVIARNSTFFYKGKQIQIQEIAEKLGARYVVEGSVRKAGNRIRITAQLIDAATESHLWSQTYGRELIDIFNLQDDIAQKIAAAVSVEHGQSEMARTSRIPTENLRNVSMKMRHMFHLIKL
jgi:TolB-like protein